MEEKKFVRQRRIHQRWKILEHTADLRIKAFGKTKEELFKNALSGMAGVQKENLKITNYESRIKRKVKIEAMDLTALLIDFLSEVLTTSQINRAVFYEVNFKKFSDTQLEAEIEGIKIEKFDEDIKAATYHGAEIVKKGNLYEVTVIYDI